MNQLHIAEAFSLGQFSGIFDYFSEQIVWEIVGQQRLVGIEAVQQHCLEIEDFFKHNVHDFKIGKILQHHTICIIQGSAEFSSKNSITKIKACDIYTFNDNEKLLQIESFCIQLA